MTNITEIIVTDIRVPTSDTLLGSDPFHKKPNYSCVYTTIKLSNGIEGNLHQMSPKKQALTGHAHTILSLIHRFRLEQRHGTKNRAWKPAQKNWE